MLYSEIRRNGVDVVEYSPKLARDGCFNVFHIHWPEFFLKRKSRVSMLKSMWKSISLIDLMRERGAKVIWTIHDLKAHEQHYAFWENRFWTGVAKRLDGVISLTETGLRLAREKLPAISEAPSFVIPHGHYRDVYSNSMGRSEARAKLGIAESAFVVAHVGLIRPYKNVPRLIRVFREIERPDAVLVVGGQPLKKKFEPEIRSAATGSDHVRLFLKWIQDDELQLYFNAADLLVFPYKDILNSGSALLGLSFDRPVLVPRLGAMAELQNSVGSNWVRTYEGELNPAILAEAMDWALTEKRGQRAPLDDLDWSSIARQTIAAYRTITGNGV